MRLSGRRKHNTEYSVRNTTYIDVHKSKFIFCLCRRLGILVFALPVVVTMEPVSFPPSIPGIETQGVTRIEIDEDSSQARRSYANVIAVLHVIYERLPAGRQCSVSTKMLDRCDVDARAKEETRDGPSLTMGDWLRDGNTIAPESIAYPES